MGQEFSAPSTNGLIPHSGLLGPTGQPVSSSNFKKSPPPKLGEAFGTRWYDNSLAWHSLPGGGVVQFDLNRLTLADFRMMKDHYQVNASLSVLSFMMHQLDWKIECSNAKIKTHVEENIDKVWTQLIRGLSTAFWAGYAPNVLQWENDVNGKTVQLTKIKDLVPEEAFVHWKIVEGWAPPQRPKPQLRVYDGIDQLGGPFPIPSENSLWYPLLMQNGDYYGKKLLRPAFTSWYFSIIMHLFSNRYFERYGEPLPIGRAPYEEELDVNGKKVSGREAMLGILSALRNRSAVVLPDQRTQTSPTHSEYDYSIEYLESQMRGADFERYLMRLDEEISLALFTPLLMLRTADVGSYNLGTQHAQVYMQMLNALAGDMKEYLDPYVIRRMVEYNFGPNAAPCTIEFRKLGDDRMEIVTAVLQQLFANNTAKPDLDQLGEIAGLTLTEVQQLTAPDPTAADPNAPPADPNAPPPPGGAGGSGNPPAGSKTSTPPPNGGKTGKKTAASLRITADMYERVHKQYTKANRDGSDFTPSFGYQRQLEEALAADGVDAARISGVHATLSTWASELTSMSFDNSADMFALLKKGLTSKVEELVNEAAN